jgi:hypothetical protein
MMFMLGFFIAQAIRYVYNRLAQYRQKKMESLWDDDLSPIEIRIEVYGLGRYTGMHDEITNITVPIDIFQRFSQRYDVTVDDLTKVFAKGVSDGLREHNEYTSQIRRHLDLLIGTPEELRQDEGVNKT